MSHSLDLYTLHSILMSLRFHCKCEDIFKTEIIYFILREKKYLCKIQNGFNIQFWWLIRRRTFVWTEQNEDIYSFVLHHWFTGELNEPCLIEKCYILNPCGNLHESCRLVFSRCAHEIHCFHCFKKNHLQLTVQKQWILRLLLSA